MNSTTDNLGLHRFAVVTAVLTYVLLGAGGLVTSHEAGMAVPDWPNSFGYNMFFFPVSQWTGGILYEHTHRLIASGVGLLTGVLALWLYGWKARGFMWWTGLVLVVLGVAVAVLRPQLWRDGFVAGLTGLLLLGTSLSWPRSEPAPAWLRRLGLIAFVGVVLQGVLGGLRVVWFKDELGIVHATIGQLFFALLCAIALFTSRWWRRLMIARHETAGLGSGQPDRVIPESGSEAGAAQGLYPRYLVSSVTLLILVQLILGATMRHEHAGLAIRDFPLAYGQLWPATDSQSVARYNQQRMELMAENPITAFQIQLQMIHRVLAVVILAGVAWCVWRIWRLRRTGDGPGDGSQAAGRGSLRQAGTPAATYGSVAAMKWAAMGRLAWIWLGLIVVQVLLGALTIWSNKAADIATAHVLTGALLLVAGVLLSLISFHKPESARCVPFRSGAPADSPATGPATASL